MAQQSTLKRAFFTESVTVTVSVTVSVTQCVCVYLTVECGVVVSSVQTPDQLLYNSITVYRSRL